MTDTQAIRAIENYITDILGEPQYSWPDDEFKLCSYSRSAAYEIMSLIMDESLRPPPYISGRIPQSHVEILHEYISDMDYYAETCDHETHRLIFSIARDTGLDILYSLFL